MRYRRGLSPFTTDGSKERVFVLLTTAKRKDTILALPFCAEAWGPHYQVQCRRDERNRGGAKRKTYCAEIHGATNEYGK